MARKWNRRGLTAATWLLLFRPSIEDAVCEMLPFHRAGGSDGRGSRSKGGAKAVMLLCLPVSGHVVGVVLGVHLDPHRLLEGCDVPIFAVPPVVVHDDLNGLPSALDH